MVEDGRRGSSASGARRQSSGEGTHTVAAMCATAAAMCATAAAMCATAAVMCGTAAAM